MILEQLQQYKPYSISPGYNTSQIIYGVPDEQNDMIPGTTYPSSHKHHKAIEGIVMTDINEEQIDYLHDHHSILLTLQHQQKTKGYLEYDIHNQRFILVAVESYSAYLYTLLLTAVNYLYSQYQVPQFQTIYENWYRLDMANHHHGSNYDANEYQLIENLANQLVKMMEDIIIQQKCFLYLHYDSVEELLDYLKLSFSHQSLTETFLFHQEKDFQLFNIEKSKKTKHTFQKTKHQLLDIEPLYTPEEIAKLPLFLQESIKDNEALYMNNRHFLDPNDFDLIKSFQRGKTWTCLYYGPSGTGKTTKILSVAGALGLPSMKMVGSRSIDEASLFGKYVLRNGETVFEYGPLALMMKYGGMFIFDEINMVDSDIISSLNDVLDGTKQKILDNGEIIHAHHNFRFAESMNIGYAGTNEMNISHKSRIQNKIKIAKLSIDKMRDIIVKETQVDQQIATKMASLMDAFNNVIMIEGNETTQRIDLRNLINWAHKTVDLDGDVLRASLTTIISDLAEEDDEIVNLEDINQIMASDGAAGHVMSQIVHEFQNEDE